MSRRLLKEIRDLVGVTEENPTLKLVSPPHSLAQIEVSISVPENPLYSGQTFVVSYTPGGDYPFHPPTVVFNGNTIPLHPHVYSNGHICLNILYDGWTPVQTLLSVVLSLQSILAGNSLAERPPDDDLHCGRGSSDPQKTRWVFHDDNV